MWNVNIVETKKDNIMKHMEICGETTEIVIHASKNSICIFVH
jgi:hypothetical protein